MNKDLERKIIREALKNPRAFAPLYERYYEGVFRFIQGKVQRMDLAGELTSNVFTKAMVNLKKYEDRGFPFSSWLYRIASNEVMDHFRRLKRTPTMEVSEQMMIPLGNDLEEKIHRESTIERLLEILSNLDSEIRKLIEMRYFDQLSFKEIGGILNIQEDAAKRRVYRAMDKYKNAVKTGGDEV